MSANRCDLADPNNPVYIRYHDEEWGVPVHEEHIHFEFLLLEGAQAGLSWSTILAKREGYRLLFHQFDPMAVAHMSDPELETILLDKRIIRNRLKVYGARQNAQAFLRVQEDFGTFDEYIWQWVDGKPIQNAWKDIREVPAKTPLSDRISRDLKKRGFIFVGSTIVYAHMQATGIVNDHLITCFRHHEVKTLG